MAVRQFDLLQVDNKRQDLEIRDSKEIDATKLGRFVRINELRWVTEYNPLVIDSFSKLWGTLSICLITQFTLSFCKHKHIHLELLSLVRQASPSMGTMTLNIKKASQPLSPGNK